MAGREAEVLVWLDAFASRVRERDLDGGRALFDEACRSFGTRGEVLDGLDDLVERQWRPTWTSTQGFAFDPATVRVISAVDGSQAVVTGCWSSDGVREDGSTFPRRGRATIVVVPGAEGDLRAVHSHFSESPEPPPA